MVKNRNWVLYLVNSTLGWMFTRRVPDCTDDDNENIILVEKKIYLEIAFWDLETIGNNMITECLQLSRFIDND